MTIPNHPNPNLWAVIINDRCAVGTNCTNASSIYDMFLHINNSQKSNNKHDDDPENQIEN